MAKITVWKPKPQGKRNFLLPYFDPPLSIWVLTSLYLFAGLLTKKVPHGVTKPLMLGDMAKGIKKRPDSSTARFAALSKRRKTKKLKQPDSAEGDDVLVQRVRTQEVRSRLVYEGDNAMTNNTMIDAGDSEDVAPATTITTLSSKFDLIRWRSLP